MTHLVCLRAHSSHSFNSGDIQAARQTPEQVLKAFSHDIGNATGAADAVEAASAAHGGRCPDAMFLCAGTSRPGFWVEQDEASLTLTMQETYWAQAWTALVCFVESAFM